MDKNHTGGNRRVWHNSKSRAHIAHKRARDDFFAGFAPLKYGCCKPSDGELSYLTLFDILLILPGVRCLGRFGMTVSATCNRRDLSSDDDCCDVRTRTSEASFRGAALLPQCHPSPFHWINRRLPIEFGSPTRLAKLGTTPASDFSLLTDTRHVGFAFPDKCPQRDSLETFRFSDACFGQNVRFIKF